MGPRLRGDDVLKAINGETVLARHMSDDEAAGILMMMMMMMMMKSLDGEALAEPRMLKFNAGKRKQVRNKNVVAVGLASGFLEPLAARSIHLIRSTEGRLVTFFPDAGFNQADIKKRKQVAKSARPTANTAVFAGICRVSGHMGADEW